MDIAKKILPFVLFLGLVPGLPALAGKPPAPETVAAALGRETAAGAALKMKTSSLNVMSVPRIAQPLLVKQGKPVKISIS